MHGNQVWCAWLFRFWRFCSFSNLAIFPSDYGLSMGVKNRIGLKKFRQVEADEICNLLVLF